MVCSHPRRRLTVLSTSQVKQAAVQCEGAGLWVELEGSSARCAYDRFRQRRLDRVFGECYAPTLLAGVAVSEGMG